MPKKKKINDEEYKRLVSECYKFVDMTATDGWKSFISALMAEGDRLRSEVDVDYNHHDEAQVSTHAKTASALKKHVKFIGQVLAPLHAAHDSFVEYISQNALFISENAVNVTFSDVDYTMAIEA